MHTTLSPTFRHNSTSNQFIEVRECVNNEGVREVTLNAVKSRNSLSLGMMEAILEAVSRDWSNKELRCIVLSANGSVWSAGHDLKELISHQGNREQQKLVFRKLSDLISCIRRAPVPVVAKVNGLAAAAGCQLVASCDIIVATDTSKFSTPG